jgi:hypothetical protein
MMYFWCAADCSVEFCLGCKVCGMDYILGDIAKYWMRSRQQISLFFHITHLHCILDQRYQLTGDSC